MDELSVADPVQMGAERSRPLDILAGAVELVSKAAVAIAVCAIVFTTVILTYAVVARYAFHASTDWQDEVSVFMLVGSTFFCGAFVQAKRGHVGIDLLAEYLPPRANRIRLVLVDLISAAFCCFFTWKSWTLCFEAFREGQTTSTPLAPPLWIPYSLMAVGMSLLVLQILLQLAARSAYSEKAL